MPPSIRIMLKQLAPNVKLLKYPPAVIFDGQLKTHPIPVLADPKKIIQALDRLRDLKSFPSG